MEKAKGGGGGSLCPTDMNTKTIQFISPSASSICIACGVDVKVKYSRPIEMKMNLWEGPKSERRKTSSCLKLEKYLSTSFDRETDATIVCKTCFRSVENANQKIEDKRDRLAKARAEMQSKYLRTVTNRVTPSDPNIYRSQSPRKRLNFNPSNVTVVDEHARIGEEDVPEDFQLPSNFEEDVPSKRRIVVRAHKFILFQFHSMFHSHLGHFVAKVVAVEALDAECLKCLI